MTDDGEPIRQYLDQLRLSLRIPEAGQILVEAEDHLRAATADGVAAGLTEQEAQLAAAGAAGLAAAVCVVLLSTHVATGRPALAVSVLGYLCLGLVITYGARMVRMLRDQAREPGELA